MTRNGGAAVVETLAAHGVETVFGIPGTHNLELYRWFAATGIRPVTPRHEQGAGYAADAAAWVSGRPGVVVTTSGPGLLNAAAAAATSWAESRPVLLLSPGAPTGTGSDLGRLHETKDATGALERIVAWSRRVSSPEEAADAVAAAFSAFATGRPRPVHIEIPLDVLEAPWTGPAPTAAHPPAPAAPADAAARRGRPAAPGPQPAGRGGRRRRRRGGPAAGGGRGARRAGSYDRQRQGRARRGPPAVGGRVRAAAGAAVGRRGERRGAGRRQRAGRLRPVGGRDHRPHPRAPRRRRRPAAQEHPRRRRAARRRRRHADGAAHAAARGGPTATRGRPSCARPAGRKRWSTAPRSPRSWPPCGPGCPPTGSSPATRRRSPTSAPCTCSTSRRRARSATRPASPRSATASRPRSARRWPRPTGRWRACSATAR